MIKFKVEFVPFKTYPNRDVHDWLSTLYFTK